MFPRDKLTSEGEAQWLRLKTHIEWCGHFALGFIFSAHPGVIRVLRERLADIYRARVTRLQTTVPESPASLSRELLPRLLRPSLHQQSLQAPIWIDLSGRDGDGWKQARLEFLIRLNEQRETLRKALKQPLVLVLPLEEFSDTRELVPDLWSIRDFTLKTGPWIAAAFGSRDADLPKISKPVKGRFSDYERSLITEWRRLLEKKKKDRGFLLAADRALKVCKSNRNNDLAHQIASSQQTFAEEQIRRTGETPESLRDLSVSLDNVGDTARGMGEWEKAKQSFEEALSITIPLSQKYSNHDDYKELANHFRKRLKILETD